MIKIRKRTTIPPNETGALKLEKLFFRPVWTVFVRGIFFGLFSAPRARMLRGEKWVLRQSAEDIINFIRRRYKNYGTRLQSKRPTSRGQIAHRRITTALGDSRRYHRRSRGYKRPVPRCEYVGFRRFARRGRRHDRVSVVYQIQKPRIPRFLLRLSRLDGGGVCGRRVHVGGLSRASDRRGICGACLCGDRSYRQICRRQMDQQIDARRRHWSHGGHHRAFACGQRDRRSHEGQRVQRGRRYALFPLRRAALRPRYAGGHDDLLGLWQKKS